MALTYVSSSLCCDNSNGLVKWWATETAHFLELRNIKMKDKFYLRAILYWSIASWYSLTATRKSPSIRCSTQSLWLASAFLSKAIPSSYFCSLPVYREIHFKSIVQTDIPHVKLHDGVDTKSYHSISPPKIISIIILWLVTILWDFSSLYMLLFCSNDKYGHKYIGLK